MGDFENGGMEGDGMWRNKDGEKYIGQWKGNKANGYGIYITRASRYQGKLYFIKVIFTSSSNREKGSSNSKMEIRIEATMRMEYRMDSVSIIGKMDKRIVDNSQKDSVMVKGNGTTKKEIIMRVISQTIKRTGKGPSNGRMETSTKANS